MKSTRRSDDSKNRNKRPSSTISGSRLEMRKLGRSVVDDICCCRTRICQCCLNCLNSMTLNLSLLVVVTFVVLLMINIYLMISNSIWIIEHNEIRIESGLNLLSFEMEKLLSNTKQSVLDMKGLMRPFAEWMLSGSDVNERIDRAVTAFNPLFESYQRRFSGYEVNLGMWMYLNSTDYVSFEVRSGVAYFNNLTKCEVLEIFDPALDDFTNQTYEVSDAIDTFTVDDMLDKGQEGEFWDNYVVKDGSESRMFLSYSAGSGPLEGVGDPNTIYTVNPWIRVDIGWFREYLKEYSPRDATSYVIDFTHDQLLAVSIDEETELSQADDFMSPCDYTTDPDVSKTHRRVMEEYIKTIHDPNNDFFSEEGVYYYLSVDSFAIIVRKFKEIDEGTTDWLLIAFINNWTVHMNFLYQLFFFFFLIICKFCSLACICGFCITKSKCEVDHLVTQMNRTQRMELDSIKLRKCAFFEVDYLQRKFLLSVERLKEYRRFLPETLLLDERNDDDLMVRVGDDVELFSETSAPVSSVSSRNNSSDVMENMSKFNLETNYKDIIVLYIYFGYQHNSRTLDEIYEKLLTGRREGLIYEFDFDSMTIIILNSSKLVFAVNQMKRIEEDFHRSFNRVVTKNPENGDDFDVNIRLFVCLGRGFFGNLGNEKIKKFKVGGPVIEKVRGMAGTAPGFVRTSVCGECSKILSKNKNGGGGVYEMREITSDIFEIGKNKKVKDDEWMYEMEQIANFSRWDLCNEGARLSREGRFDEAVEKFEEYQVSYPEDPITRYWISRIREMKILATVQRDHQDHNLIEVGLEDNNNNILITEDLNSNSTTQVESFHGGYSSSASESDTDTEEEPEVGQVDLEAQDEVVIPKMEKKGGFLP